MNIYIYNEMNRYSEMNIYNEMNIYIYIMK